MISLRANQRNTPGITQESKSSRTFYGCLLVYCLLVSVSTAVAADAKKAADKAAPDAGATAPAESAPSFRCEAGVSYTWQPKANPPEPRQPPQPAPKEELVFHDYLRVTSATEEQAKSEITNRTDEAKAAALRACLEAHQNQTLCVQRQMKIAGRDYAMLDYGARKAFLESVTADCHAATGRCLSASIGEATCTKEEPPKASPAPDAAASKDKPADKKK